METKPRYMTTEFLESQLVENKARIKELEEYLTTYQRRSVNSATELQSMRDQMHEFTLEQINEEALTQEQADKIANICGFEISKEVEIEISVIYNLTVNVPHGTDVESIINDIDFDSVSYGEEVTYLSSMIDDVSF
jgi:hypothetical protein